MSGIKRFASDITYISDDNFDIDNSCDSDFKYIEYSCRETYENFSDYYADSDESENSFSIQDFRQWCKIDMQNVPPVCASFPLLGSPGLNFTATNDAIVLDYFEFFFEDVMLQVIVRDKHIHSAVHE